MQVKEFVDYLDNYLQIGSYVDFCPNGLQVEGKSEVKKVATAVSANLKTIEIAAAENVDALIVHHGLFWERDPYPIIGAKLKKIRCLIERGISLIAYHLPLDAHKELGNNWKAALELGWTNLEPFATQGGLELGVKGFFASQSIESFKDKLEAFYGQAARTALGGKKNVRSAALISGGAYKEIPQAAKEKVDCFITGNVDEPAWSLAHEEGINFLALGHSATERVGPLALKTHIQTRFNLEAIFIDVFNPF